MGLKLQAVGSITHLFKVINISRIFNIWLALKLLVVALLVTAYFNALHGPFLIDDFTSVIPARITEISLGELWRVANGDISGMFGRSIPVISFALNNYFGGDAAFSYKLVNLCLSLIHI